MRVVRPDSIQILQYFNYNPELIDIIQTVENYYCSGKTRRQLLSFWAEVNGYGDANSENNFQELLDFPCHFSFQLIQMQ